MILLSIVFHLLLDSLLAPDSHLFFICLVQTDVKKAQGLAGICKEGGEPSGLDAQSLGVELEFSLTLY